MPIALIIALAVILLLALWVASTYNRLIQLRNRVDNAWAQVAVQLKRRWDLIPNLVETVKGYASHESKTLEAVIAARNGAVAAGGSGSIEASEAAENQLTGTLRQLFAVAEAYPDLKANTNFLSLQTELTETENKISFARQFFNDIVLRYNNVVQMFPSSIIAGLFGFSARASFEVDAAESNAPQVSFE
jgi:LemA protein